MLDFSAVKSKKKLLAKEKIYAIIELQKCTEKGKVMPCQKAKMSGETYEPAVKRWE